MTNNAFAIFISLIVGIIFSSLLYFKKSVQNDKKAIFLFVLRLICVSFLVFLLISPAFIQKIWVSEKQKIILAIDNSGSIASGSTKNQREALLKTLQNLLKSAENKGFDVICQTFDQNIEKEQLATINFNKQTTDLDGFLTKIANQNDKIASVILVSDGIYNQGSSPIYNLQSFPIFTIGIGDTTQKKDAFFKSNLYNEIVGLDNIFPIVTNVRIVGYKGKTVKVKLKSKDKTIDTKLQTIQNDDQYIQFQFQSSEKTTGFKQYILEIEPLDGEFSLKNNIANLFFEVVAAKQSILLAAAVPHPDIKAIKALIEKNKNWSVETYIPQINTLKNKPYDLVILHQFPHNEGIGNEFFAQINQSNTPKFFITGNATDYQNLSNYLKNFQITPPNGSFDKVNSFLNNTFQRITIEEENTKILSQLPPISVPFSEIYASNQWETVLYQQVGTIKTEKPLLALNLKQTPFTGIFIGDGLWQWRMNEIRQTDKAAFFDSFFTQIFQLLASKDSKAKFILKPVANQFYAFEKISFRAEIKNELNQSIAAPNIELTIVDEKNKKYTFNFENQDVSNLLEINGLPQGIYKYTASIMLNSKTEIAKGSFNIKSYDIEQNQTKADFELLRQLSKKSSGSFFTINSLQGLDEKINNLNVTQSISTNESLLELIDLQWFLYILIVWISVEWFFRKMYYSV